MNIFTNGCFDLFHEGHKNILRVAVDLAGNDCLTIALNSDLSIKKLKGEGRPVDPFAARKKNIKEYLNTLVFYYGKPCIMIEEFGTEEDLFELIKVIKPDMILHAGEEIDVIKYTGHEISPVCVIARYKDVSTTKLIEERN